MHRLNPHEPEITKDLISTQMPTCYGRKVLNIYQGGKLNACLSVDGELIITVIQECNDAFNLTNQCYCDMKKALSTEEGVESFIAPEKVVYVSIGGQDLAYIDSYGFVYQVVSGENIKVYPSMRINIDEKVKLVSVGLTFTFAVTETNKIYAWQ